MRVESHHPSMGCLCPASPISLVKPRDVTDTAASSPLTLTTTLLSLTLFTMKTPDHYDRIRNAILSDRRALDAVADRSTDKVLLDAIRRYLESELDLVDLAYDASTQEHAPSLDEATPALLR